MLRRLLAPPTSHRRQTELRELYRAHHKEGNPLAPLVPLVKILLRLPHRDRIVLVGHSLGRVIGLDAFGPGVADRPVTRGPSQRHLPAAPRTFSFRWKAGPDDRATAIGARREVLDLSSWSWLTRTRAPTTEPETCR